MTVLKNIDEIILKNITGEEKFKIICRAKKININEITRDIINKIEFSDIADKNALIRKGELWDEDYTYTIKEYTELYIDKTLLFNKQEAIKYFKIKENEIKEFWIKLNKKEKELIKIALDCKVYNIKCDIE